MTVRPLSAYCLRRTVLRGLVIGYGYAPLEDIRQYGPALARAITREMALAMPATHSAGAGAGVGRPTPRLINIPGALDPLPDAPHRPTSGPAPAGTTLQEPGSAS